MDSYFFDLTNSLIYAGYLNASCVCLIYTFFLWFNIFTQLTKSVAVVILLVYESFFLFSDCIVNFKHSEILKINIFCVCTPKTLFIWIWILNEKILEKEPKEKVPFKYIHGTYFQFFYIYHTFSIGLSL